MGQKNYHLVGSIDTVENVTVGGANGIPFVAGDDATLHFRVLDGAGSPEDLSSATLEFALADGNGTTKTPTDVSAADGLVKVELETADTDSLADSINFELRRTDSGNEVSYLQGQIEITGAV